MHDWFMIYPSGFTFIVMNAQLYVCKNLYWSGLIITSVLQVILQSETIQELTNTSKQLSSLQHEITMLRQTADVQKAENVSCATAATLTMCRFFVCCVPESWTILLHILTLIWTIYIFVLVQVFWITVFSIAIVVDFKIFRFGNVTKTWSFPSTFLVLLNWLLSVFHLASSTSCFHICVAGLKPEYHLCFDWWTLLNLFIFCNFLILRCIKMYLQSLSTYLHLFLIYTC